MRWILACALVAFDLQLQLKTGWRFGSVASPVWKTFIGQKKPARNRDNGGSLLCCHACLGLIFRGNATPKTGAVACFSHLWWNRVNCDIYECRYTIFVGVSSILKQYVYIYIHTWLHIYIYTDMMIWIFVIWYILLPLQRYCCTTPLPIDSLYQVTFAMPRGFWAAHSHSESFPSPKDFCLKKMPIDLYTLGQLGHA